MATRKQKAAARRNIKKAQAARRKKGHKKGHRKSKRSHRGGHIPLKILERRLKKLSTIVHKRRGR